MGTIGHYSRECYRAVQRRLPPCRDRDAATIPPPPLITVTTQPKKKLDVAFTVAVEWRSTADSSSGEDAMRVERCNGAERRWHATASSIPSEQPGSFGDSIGMRERSPGPSGSSLPDGRLSPASADALLSSNAPGGSALLGQQVALFPAQRNAQPPQSPLLEG
ncbi:hypothetical protein MRX96_008581 [Rhipicephalus microplus]